MKPSNRIIQIIKDMAREEAKSRGGYFGWEGLEDLSQVIAQVEFSDLLPLAILKYLDEKSLVPSEERKEK